MSQSSILILSDDRPGHYHLAEGVAAALQRLAPGRTTRLSIMRRRLLPARALMPALHARVLSPLAALKLGYDIDLADVPAAGIVISAGGDTIAANVAIALARGIPNVFCGTLRHARPEDFSLVVSSYERHARLPRHLVTLKPTAMDPDALGRPKEVPPLDGRNPPATMALLVGGDSGLFRYEEDEWRRLIAFLAESHRAWGTRWMVSTSRRTEGWIGDALAAAAASGPAIARLVDYRTSGPGTLPLILGSVEAVLCTEDSSTMISESIAARLPTIGISPRRHAFKPEEAEYRALLATRAWCRFLPLAELGVERLGMALAEVRVMPDNHLELLARALATALPGYGRTATLPGPAATTMRAS